jgi:chromosome segregation ATPase
MSRQVDELAREVESLHGELEEARKQLQEHESALALLEEQRSETADRLELARRQIAELGGRVERRQAELEEARQQALYDSFLEVVERRDEAAHEAAARLDAALEALSRLQQLREEAATALGSVPVRFDAAVPDEPAELDEAWTRVSGLVRADLEYKLEDELVHAAATSPGGRAIQELPVHLREMAIQRRRELQRRNRHSIGAREAS